MKALGKAMVLAALVIATNSAMAETDKGSPKARFAVAKVSNPLDIPLKYQYRWDGGEWKSATANPGRTMIHSWKYQFQGQNNSPTLEVRFDADIGEGAFFRTYKLKKYAVQYRTVGGKRYRLGFSVLNKILKLTSSN